MGLFGPSKPKPMSFKKAVAKTAEALTRLEANAVTQEELKNVADGWLALATELNPAYIDKPEDKGK